MRVPPSLPLLAVAALLLAGCAKPDAPAAAPPAADAASATGAAAGNETAAHVLQFAGGYQEATLPVDVSFAPTDSCFLVTSCPQREIDLVPVVPADAPVELSVTLAVNSNVNAFVTGSDDVSFVQYSSEYASGQLSIDVLLVRAASGTVSLVLYHSFPSLGAVADQAATATGTVHTVVRAGVVPAYVPVAVELGPGDVVNATGDIEQLVAYPPGGAAALRDLTYPFGLAVPAGAPAGPYILIVRADEAVRLTGPNRTLSAHRLAYSQTEPVDVASGQETTWEMAVPGLPVQVGLILQSKDNVPGCCTAGGYLGPHHLSLTAPGNVAILTDQDDCVPASVDFCDMTLLGSSSTWYSSEFLDEHLVAGSYQASVAADTANGFQAYSWAVTIR